MCQYQALFSFMSIFQNPFMAELPQKGRSHVDIKTPLRGTKTMLGRRGSDRPTTGESAGPAVGLEALEI
jgi:hypothetical protein